VEHNRLWRAYLPHGGSNSMSVNTTSESTHQRNIGKNINIHNIKYIYYKSIFYSDSNTIGFTL
jgi:hypothetical protein